jgi:ribosomal protein S18 acetylase RimI-like enzyme
MEIRRVRDDEWEALREIRLHALAEAPEAFATTYDEAISRPESWWREWAAAAAEGPRQSMFLAWDGGVAVGIGGGFATEEGFQVISMWVHPDDRGRGIGRSLLEAAVKFAGDADVFLWVADGNDAAEHLYDRYGFVRTGASELLRPGSRVLVRKLKLGPHGMTVSRGPGQPVEPRPAAPPAPPEPSAVPPLRDPKDVVREAIGCWEGTDGLDRMEALLAPGYVHHTAFGDWTFAEFRHGMAWIESQFGGRAYTIEHVLAEGDLIAAYLSWTATRRSDGSAVDGRGAYHCRIAGGLIAEDWDVFAPGS